MPLGAYLRLPSLPRPRTLGLRAPASPEEGLSGSTHHQPQWEAGLERRRRRPSFVLPPSSMSPPPRGAHPIRAPLAHSSPLGARSRPPLLGDRRRSPPQLPGGRPSSDGTGQAVSPAATMKAEAGDNSMINLSVQQVLSLWAHGTSLRHLTEMWYWVFLWALFSSLFVHGAAGVLMFVMLQRHRQGRVISVIVVSIGFLGSLTGAMITSAAVAGIYRVAGKSMAPLEALVFGVGQTVLTLIISFSRILATL
nr:transmembrane protein 170B isoform X1 [Pogona vitticeps]XP_020652756.1 transmembrane protein 170B isoform X2 [Pogona vitticeps]